MFFANWVLFSRPGRFADQNARNPEEVLAGSLNPLGALIATSPGKRAPDWVTRPKIGNTDMSVKTHQLIVFAS